MLISHLYSLSARQNELNTIPTLGFFTDLSILFGVWAHKLLETGGTELDFGILGIFWVHQQNICIALFDVIVGSKNMVKCGQKLISAPYT